MISSTETVLSESTERGIDNSEGPLPRYEEICSFSRLRRLIDDLLRDFLDLKPLNDVFTASF